MSESLYARRKLFKRSIHRITQLLALCSSPLRSLPNLNGIQANSIIQSATQNNSYHQTVDLNLNTLEYDSSHDSAKDCVGLAFISFTLLFATNEAKDLLHLQSKGWLDPLNFVGDRT